jgi:Flp pilus assembly protein TadG
VSGHLAAGRQGHFRNLFVTTARSYPEVIFHGATSPRNEIPDVGNGGAVELINYLSWPKRRETMRHMQPEISFQLPRSIRVTPGPGSLDNNVSLDANEYRVRRRHRATRQLASCSRPVRATSAWNRATAALEFALATPMLVVILGGAADLGLAQYYRTNLANAVAAGAEYAYLTGTTVTSTNIQSVVTNTMFLAAGDSANLSVSVTGPRGYCVTGTGPTMTSASAGSVCGGDGSIAGTYVIISATYTHSGLMNGFMSLSSEAITESATVRLN